MTIGHLKSLLIAHRSAPELPSLCEILRAATMPQSGESDGGDSILFAETLDESLTEIKKGWFPDLVIVYQGVPDEFPQSGIDELIGLLPLARFIVAFGPWCESIGRTEQRWPVAWCVPVRHLATRLHHELRSQSTGEPVLPPTSSRDEVFSRSAARVNSTVARTELTAVVFGDDRHFLESVRTQLQASGIQVLAPPATADFVFVSATGLSASTETELDRVGSEFPASRVFLLSDLLTPGQLVKLAAAGVTPMSQLRFGEELAAMIGALEPRRVSP